MNQASRGRGGLGLPVSLGSLGSIVIFRIGFAFPLDANPR